MGKKELTPLNEAFRRMDEVLSKVSLSSEKIPVHAADGMVLRADQFSRLSLPPFNKSAMDGYAVREGDQREEYNLLGTIAAGESKKVFLEPGTAVKVMTGAPVPEGAGKVIRQENTVRNGNKIRVADHSDSPNICWKAEDVCVGQEVMTAGMTIDPLAIGNLISCGIMEVEVARRVRISVISTGSEIVDSPGEIKDGRIMNTNGPLLAALSKDCGFEVIGEHRVPDEKNATTEALRAAAEQADITVLSGGVSVGDYDYVTGALGDTGLNIHFSRLAVKPGKPTVFATAGRRTVLGLPGNPVSVFLMFHLFVRRAASLLSGRRPVHREFPVRLKDPLSRRKSWRAEYRPCRLLPDGFVESLDYHGSAHLTGLIGADGFFLVPSGIDAIDAGETVSFFPVGRFWKY